MEDLLAASALVGLQDVNLDLLVAHWNVPGMNSDMEAEVDHLRVLQVEVLLDTLLVGQEMVELDFAMEVAPLDLEPVVGALDYFGVMG